MSTTEAPKVLLVDDDELVLFTMRKLFETQSLSVDVAMSGQEALARLPQSHYDAIFCDMWMPGMTGKEVYSQVKEEFPEYLGRFVMLTGDISSEAAWDFIEERHLPYVLKPVSLPELRRKLQELMHQQLPAVQAAQKTIEGRRHRRVAMKAPARVRATRWSAGTEIANVVNASKEGIYFLTERPYRVGTEVLVSFPYSGTCDFEQNGRVARVDERNDGRRGVAIALGDGVRLVQASEEDRERQRILGLADLASQKPFGEAAPREEIASIAELKRQLEHERHEARRLAQELADFRAAYECATVERDRLQQELAFFRNRYLPKS